MNWIYPAARGLVLDAVDGWNRFWFTPSEPHTLAVIRICAGAMLLYTHFVYSLDLMAFLGSDSWIPSELSRQIYQNMGSTAVWSHLWLTESPIVLWILHVLALLVFALLTVGLFSRTMSVLAWLITVSYCHRLNGSWFGLDHINALLAMYLMLGPCGAVYSLDHWIKRIRGGGKFKPPQLSVATNVAVRLIQVHICIVYLFGGIAKMKGDMWWNGSAVWFAVANLEYQSLDMTWLVHYPMLIALLSHITVFWETFYCVLVWPKMTRPLVLAVAVGVHGGIAMFLGMITFGLVMLIGNLAFVPPQIVRDAVRIISPSRGRAGKGGGETGGDGSSKERRGPRRKRISA